MQQILSNTYHRRSFSIIAGLLFICAVLLRYMLLPTLDPTLTLKGTHIAASLIERFLTSFMVTVLIGVFIFWLEPRIVPKADMSKIAPKEISTLLQAAIQPTEKWWFRGGTGRHLRAVTLPRMAESTKKASSTKELHIQLIDPMNLSLCQQYAIYRRGLHSASVEREVWTHDRVRKEIYATLLSIFIKAYEYPLLRLQVTLLNSFSTFRLDLSSEYVIMTKEDPQAPGVKCDKGTYFYDAYMNDLALTAVQGRTIKMSSAKLELDISSVRARLSEMELVDAQIPDEILIEAIRSTESPRSPYA